jgi:hypothetical protein
LPIKFLIYLPSHPETRSTLLSARLADLSQSGMRLMTNVVQHGSLHIVHPDPAMPEQPRLEIRVPDGEGTLALTGRVMWYDRNPGDHPYSFRVGVEFVDIGPQEQKRIQSLIHGVLTAASRPPSDRSPPPSCA